MTGQPSPSHTRIVRKYITVVSGMPRSGTSLMMRMLDAGGIPAVTDGRRAADRHNPHGYFEDERARSLTKTASWLNDANGKAVKIIYRLLPNLPPHLEYRVIFMERDLNEVFDSQQDMLQSRHDSAANQNREQMIEALAADLHRSRQWLGRQFNICTRYVPYAGVLIKPITWARHVAQFLDGELDEAAMAAMVDPSLYRHRR